MENDNDYKIPKDGEDENEDDSLTDGEEDENDEDTSDDGEEEENDASENEDNDEEALDAPLPLLPGSQGQLPHPITSSILPPQTVASQHTSIAELTDRMNDIMETYHK